MMSNVELCLEDEDIEYLDAHYLSQWSKLSEGIGKWGLKIKEFSLPEGYDQPNATLMVMIPSGYPGSPLDMFYFHPPLSKNNREPIPTLAEETHFGILWQRWSRHYKWKPGCDSLVSHIEYIKSQLTIELK